MIEIEKKYKLDKESFEALKTFLDARPEYFVHTDKEENILYEGNSISEQDKVLRIRKVQRLLDGKPSHKNWTILTVKDKATVKEDGTKSRTELESSIKEEFVPALEILGFTLKLVYEKIRVEYNPASPKRAIVCLDELPFGYYMEIEGTPEEIAYIEENMPFIPDTEMYSYPDLTTIYGKFVDGIMQARF